MEIKYHFFSKDCLIDRALSDYLQLENNLKSKKFNYENIVFANQIHSDIALTIDSVDKIHDKQNLPKADAIVTNIQKLAIAVVTADCTPILLQDKKAGVIAAVHAGWRGAKAGVIENAVLEMQKLGAKSENIFAAIGPMIRQSSYQVSADFFKDFLQEDEENKKFFVYDKSAPDHYLFDLTRYVIYKLQKVGVRNIFDIAIDTYRNCEHYASYRKATHEGGADCGRNISLIMME